MPVVPLAPSSFRVVDAVLHLLQIHQQLVHPQGGPLAHGDQLGGLKMGKAQGGQGLVFVGKLGQARASTPDQLVPDELQSPPASGCTSVLSPT